MSSTRSSSRLHWLGIGLQHPHAVAGWPVSSRACPDAYHCPHLPRQLSLNSFAVTLGAIMFSGPSWIKAIVGKNIYGGHYCYCQNHIGKVEKGSVAAAAIAEKATARDHHHQYQCQGTLPES